MSSPVPPPLPAELDALLRRMRLPHMRRTAPEVLATARAQRWDPAEVLKLLLNEEVAGRERSALATRRVEAAFPTGKTFATWDKDTLFVPGHGPICGQEGIALSRALFDDIEEQAHKLHKAGVPAVEAADLYEIPEKYKNVGIFAWDFSIGPAILKLYAEWGAK